MSLSGCLAGHILAMLRMLQQVDLSCNLLAGEIPGDIG
jgi:hypothetical protein